MLDALQRKLQNDAVRAQGIRILNRIANLGWWGNLAAAAVNEILYQNDLSFYLAVVFYLAIKTVVWILMAYDGHTEADHVAHCS